MVGIGIIGYGYWGPNLVRNFADLSGAQVVAVSDLRKDRLELVSRRYPGIRTTTDHSELIRDPKVDAVAIATPVSTHFELALAALREGKHVFVEKPFTETSEHALRLIDEAAKGKRLIQVDHTFVYTGAVKKIREIVTSGDLGDLLYYDSVRINLGLFQHDVNVIWDLATHDLSIMDYVASGRPVAVSATGISHVVGEPENVAYLTVFFDGAPSIAHIHVNWLAPVKLRRTLIGGSRKMIVYDDLEPSEKVKVFDRGISLDVYNQMISYRAGDMWAPNIPLTEALRTEVDHFVSCIEKGSQPLTDGQAGLRVVRILEAATRSLREHGRPAEVSTAGGRI